MISPSFSKSGERGICPGAAATCHFDVTDYLRFYPGFFLNHIIQMPG